MGSSKYVAVYWNQKTKKWVAYITHNKESICIGYFKNEKNAANAASQLETQKTKYSHKKS